MSVDVIDTSCVFKLQYMNVTFIFSNDGEGQAMQSMIANNDWTGLMEAGCWSHSISSEMKVVAVPTWLTEISLCAGSTEKLMNPKLQDSMFNDL